MRRIRENVVLQPRRMVIVGLDLSPTGSGVCILPPMWQPGEWNVKTAVFGHPLPNDASEEVQTERLAVVSESIANYIINEANAKNSKQVKCFIEQYSYNSKQSRAHRIGEMGGAVKLALRDCGFAFDSVPVMTVRKFLLGKLPRSDQKKLTIAALKSAGAAFGKEEDRYDAFVMANYGRSEEGMPALTLSG